MRDCYVKGSMVVESIDDERIVLFLLAITLVIYEKFSFINYKFNFKLPSVCVKSHLIFLAIMKNSFLKITILHKQFY